LVRDIGAKSFHAKCKPPTVRKLAQWLFKYLDSNKYKFKKKLDIPMPGLLVRG